MGDNQKIKMEEDQKTTIQFNMEDDQNRFNMEDRKKIKMKTKILN